MRWRAMRQCNSWKGSTAKTQTVSRPGGLKRKKLRVVCEPCNNEWMSVIENDAKRVVLPMMLGQSLFLEEAAQPPLAVNHFF
jgi:hypothetical protein